MILKKIEIENFKSINKIEFDIKRYGDSHTQLLLGVNEVGKSNILEAMSLLNTPKEKYEYSQIHNQKDEDNRPVNISFFLAFKNTAYLKYIKNNIRSGNLFNYDIINVKKNVSLKKGEFNFKEHYTFEVQNKRKKSLYIKDIRLDQNIKGSFQLSIIREDSTFIAFTPKVLERYLYNDIINVIKRYEPRIIFWKPEKSFLISSINLKEFATNIDSNVSWKNIFKLAGYTNTSKINEKISEISNFNKRKKINSLLSSKTTEYINNIWKHNIEVDIEVTETAICNISIKDKGVNNQHDFYSMHDRSQGFKQFISFILSLSIENSKINKGNNLILIHEPETHLHPSAIRDLRKELLKLGEHHYPFISTHSPFLIDRNHKERNIIIKKDNFSFTIKQQVKSEDDIRGDDVLEEAFGINIYKDLLNTKRILVEGASDKMILQKSFIIESLDYGITNGHGSNIVSIASKLNDEDITVLVLTDDDKDGKKYKEDILKMKGVYTPSNVYTIKDLVPEVIDNATIEDCLNIDYVQSQCESLYKDMFEKDYPLKLEKHSPFLNQIKIHLQKSIQEKKEINNFLERLKINISENFNPKKLTFKKNFPLLNQLTENITKRINENKRG